MLRLVLPAALLGVAVFYWWLQSSLDQPLNVPPDYRLEVRQGDSLSALARSLADQGIISHPYALLIQARLTGNPPIQRGEYRFSSEQTARILLQELVRGDVIQYQVTFPEGKTYREWLAILANQEPLSKINVVALETFIQSVGAAFGGSPEGWFFPDTYSYSRGDSPLQILARARKRMIEELDREWQGREPGLPYASPYEALIMASIIEKETAVPDERARIAGVFVRRLRKGMRLQTDPTVIYGLGDNFQGNLTRAHLAATNPYNTYRINGLPPTPIANPGLEALHAALHPAEGDSLYFVARGDGSHAFSATHEEHEDAVRKYQLNRRSDYRSDPPPGRLTE